MPTELLIVTRNFPPLVGGMEKLVYRAWQALAEDYRCTVIGPRGASAHVGPPHRVIECNESGVLRFLWQALRAGLQATKERDVALVIGGSGVVAPVCRLLASRRGIPFMSFLHGLDIVVDSRVYRKAWLPAIRRADFIVANSANTARLAREFGITGPRCTVIHPGVDVPAADPAPQALPGAAADGPLLLSVGRLVRRKGLAEFVDRCMPVLARALPGLRLLIIGDEPAAALKRDGGERARIEVAAARHDLGDAVVLHGRGSDAEVSAAVAAADLFVFPLIDVPGDVEGFGMVALEAAAHGLPTVAFDRGGVADAVADGDSGRLVAAGDYDGMAAAVTSLVAAGARDRMRARCVAFARRHDWAAFGASLRGVVAQVLVLRAALDSEPPRPE